MLVTVEECTNPWEFSFTGIGVIPIPIYVYSHLFPVPIPKLGVLRVFVHSRGNTMGILFP